ncbi:hypothetical protein CDO73_10535 [Saccharibacillus sp. O23]|uniref:hypothetical protein n=1 Tax=Saccharibacillus sp. O23 TaxID=2009338 RepID=UPI000B4E0933|nr:hypothetical protein [Saccharibacillus sp. O23]OWR30354.1 hypothetical protein CDO73_10535 [Saccharibacillus sp. O23]
MMFSMRDLLYGQYLRTREDMAAEYGGVCYIGWSPEKGTLRTNEPDKVGDSAMRVDPDVLEDLLVEETKIYLRGFEASGYNRGVYAFGYHIDSGSGKIYPILNLEERSDEEERDSDRQAAKEEKLLSPRWQGSNAFGVYPALFGEAFGDLLEMRLYLSRANAEWYEERYGGLRHARSCLFDVRVFDEVLQPIAFRALRRLRAEGAFEALNRTEGFLAYFFDHGESAETLETVMRELNGDGQFERVFAIGR